MGRSLPSASVFRDSHLSLLHFDLLLALSVLVLVHLAPPLSLDGLHPNGLHLVPLDSHPVRCPLAQRRSRGGRGGPRARRGGTLLAMRSRKRGAQGRDLPEARLEVGVVVQGHCARRAARGGNPRRAPRRHPHPDGLKVVARPPARSDESPRRGRGGNGVGGGGPEGGHQGAGLGLGRPDARRRRRRRSEPPIQVGRPPSQLGYPSQHHLSLSDPTTAAVSVLAIPSPVPLRTDPTDRSPRSLRRVVRPFSDDATTRARALASPFSEGSMWESRRRRARGVPTERDGRLLRRRSARSYSAPARARWCVGVCPRSCEEGGAPAQRESFPNDSEIS